MLHRNFGDHTSHIQTLYLLRQNNVVLNNNNVQFLSKQRDVASMLFITKNIQNLKFLPCHAIINTLRAEWLHFYWPQKSKPIEEQSQCLE